MLFPTELYRQLEPLLEERNLRGLEGLVAQQLAERPAPRRKGLPRLGAGKWRSSLLVSGHRLRHLNKLDQIPADVVVLNLEDGVPPDWKPVALQMVGLAALYLADREGPVIVRVNPVEEGGLEEIAFLEQFPVDGYRLPKVTSPSQLEEVQLKTDRPLFLSIETPEAFSLVEQFRDPQIAGFYLGLYDLFNGLALPHSLIEVENPLISEILARFSLTSRLIGKVPIGFVYQHYRDLKGFSRWVSLQRQLGMEGVGCITPAQVEVANRLFSPDLEFARRVVELFEREGPTQLEGLFIDEPIYKNCKQLLEGRGE